MAVLTGLTTMSHRAQAAKAYGTEEEALIRRGIEFRKAMDDLAARAEFQKAYDLTHSPRAAAQLGLAEFALGRWEDADAHVTEALRTPKDPFIAKYRTELDDSLTTIKNHIGRVDVVGEPPGAEVAVNGRVAGVLPLAAPVTVSAGQVDVELRAPGYKGLTRTVTVTPGQYQRMVMRLERDLPRGVAPGPVADGGGPDARRTDPIGHGSSNPATDAQPAPVAPPGAVSARGIAKWTALGLAGASLATGITSTFLYRSNVQEFESLHSHGCYDRGGQAVDEDGNAIAECQPSLNGYRTARKWQIVGFVGAGVFAATWLALMLTEPDRDEPQASPSGPPERASAALRWVCGPSSAVGISCATRF